ncbi:MAG TPA: LPS-assembly protein LptD [Anaeromyxobacter sp.]|nr:LPS-assembly protein LptD [Anaeromyxobacter sp.]
MSILAALGLVARLAIAAPVPAPSGDVRIEGDVTYEPGTGLLLVQNGAVLRRGDVVVRSRSATYDPATGEIRASGGVLVSDRTRFVAADGVRLVLNGPFEAEGVVAFVKDVPTDLSRAASAEEARGAGRNRLTFSGARLHGDRRGRFQLEGARLTLCDCPGDCAPSWEVTSRRADVIPGVRATLSWPVLRVTPRFLFVDHPVPVLVLPWLYVPLGERQTGLLLPEVDSPGSTGFTIGQPLFVTLGRSADATLTPWYAWGRKRSQFESGAPSVRGPGARLELRWAPAEGAEGQALLSWVDDLDAEPNGESGHRLAVTGRHAQRISERTSAQAAVRLFGDPLWLRDATADVLGRDWPYARSDALLSHRRDALVLEAGATYLEPLRPNGYVPGDPADGGFGAFGAGLDVASRWPYAAATLVPLGLGPLRLSGRAGYARFAPPSSALDASGRPAADRGDVRAEVSAPLVFGEVISVVPYARGAATGFAYEADRAATGAAWGVGGVTVATEVSRRFGAVRNAIAPRLEWRAGTGTAGDAIAGPAYDALDRPAAGLLSAAPPGTWQQLRAAVETRFAGRERDFARLELGQDYDVRLGRLAETFVTGEATWRRLGASASARFFAFEDRPEAAAPPRIPSDFLDRFTELRAEASISDRRGDRLRAGYLSVGPGGPGTLLAGIEPLFDVRPTPTDPTAAASIGARVVAGPATLGYDVAFPAAAGRAAYVPSCSGGGGERRVSAWQTHQHALSATWDSPCRCFRVFAALRVDDCGTVGYSASIDLSRLGEMRFR